MPARITSPGGRRLAVSWEVGATSYTDAVADQEDKPGPKPGPKSKWPIGRYWLIGAAVVVSLLFIVVLWLGPERGNRALSLTRALLNWPVIAGLLVAFLSTKFHAEVAQFVREHDLRVQTKRGTTWEANRQQPGPEVPEDEIPTDEPPQESGPTFSKADVDNALGMAAGYYTQAVTWFHKYLDVFFVPTTKRVLRWLADYGPVTWQQFETSWMSFIPDPTQRATVLNVLFANELIQQAGDLISVTEVGRAYLGHLASVSSPMVAPAAPSAEPTDEEE